MTPESHRRRAARRSACSYIGGAAHVPGSPRVIADILNRAGPLPCQYAQDQEVIHQGHLYLAPPNDHLLVEPGRLRVMRGSRENRARPAIDPLFRTAAVAYGARTVGVILTGRENVFHHAASKLPATLILFLRDVYPQSGLMSLRFFPFMISLLEPFGGDRDAAYDQSAL